MGVPAIFVAFAASALLAVALLTMVVIERRRGEINERVRRAVSDFSVADPLLDSSPHLRLKPQRDWTDRLHVLPSWLQRRIVDVSAKAGGRIKPLHLVLVAASSAMIAAGLADTLLRLGPIATLLVAASAAIGVPIMLINYMKDRYDRQFLKVFPDALDQIVRALKAGLPVTESLANVAREVADPVGAEFRRVHDEIQIAVDLERALQRASDRVRITDFRFFVASVGLHRTTGGNLAETLANLSQTIRRRNEARLKVRALSSEGRISAMMLSAMPVVLGVALSFLNPSYMSLLLDDPRGHTLLIAAAVSLTIGIFVMRGMIKRVMR